MNVNIDVDTLAFINTPAPSITRGDSFPVNITFLKNSEVVQLSDSATGLIGFKLSSAPSSDFLVSSSSWYLGGQGSNAYYSFNIDTNTQELSEAFVAAGNPNSIGCLMEIQWVDSGYKSSSQSFFLNITNSLISGEEATPSVYQGIKATTTDAQNGTDDTKWMTPMKVAQAISYFGGEGIPHYNKVTVISNDSNNRPTSVSLSLDSSVVATWHLTYDGPSLNGLNKLSAAVLTGTSSNTILTWNISYDGSGNLLTAIRS